MSTIKSVDLNHTAIKTKIQNGIYTINYKRSRSKIWNIYAKIKDETGNEIENIVLCRVCDNIYKCVNKNNSSLVRHKCYINSTGKEIDTEEEDVNAITKNKETTESVELNEDVNESTSGTCHEDYSAIYRKIKNGNYKINYNRGRSKVWNIFGKIENETGNEIENVVFCRVCRNVYKSIRQSTSNLIRHSCYINSIAKGIDTKKANVNAETKNKETTESIELNDNYTMAMQTDTEKADLNAEPIKKKTIKSLELNESTTTATCDDNYSAIREKIQNGNYKIDYKQGTGQLWNIFGNIKDAAGNEMKNLVVCRVCKNIYKFTKHRTSNLERHKCYIDSLAKENDTKTADVNAETKNKETTESVKLNETETSQANYTTLKTKIKNGTYKIIYHQGRSHIWNVYGRIEDETGNEFENIVICRYCKNIYKYTRHTTSNLVRHSCYVDSRLKETDIEKKDVNADTKNKAIQILTQWAVTNCRPFGIVADSGFEKFAQYLISIGAKFGTNINMETLLPNPTTISGNVNNIYNNYVEKMKIELNSNKNIGFGLTSDLWTDNYLRRTYIALNIHYIKDGHLLTRLLGMTSMKGEKCTDENIKNKITKILKEFDLELNDKVTIVTDRDSDMAAVFHNNNQLYCVDHLLRNTMQNAIQEVPEVAELSSACVKLVEYLKSYGFNSELNTTMKSFSPNSWNTIYYVFAFFEKNKTEIVEFLQEKGELQRIEKINAHHILALVRIFEPFQETFKKLKAETSPTMHLAYVYTNYLINQCKSDNKDIDVIKLLKEKLITFLRSVVLNNLKLLHKVALFLFPPTNKLSQLPENERILIKNECKRMMESYLEAEESSETQNSMIEITDHNAKVFSEFISQSENMNTVDKINSEIYNYEVLSINFTSDFNVLKWWKARKDEFPTLYKVSIKVLAIPVSSAASERTFLLARNLISEKKCSFGSQDEIVNEIMFLHSNISADELEKELLNCEDSMSKHISQT